MDRGATLADDARARNLHGNEDAQILPLVFFLGIAFFTSVVLVINTGRTTVGRMRAQNAVDAAVVSGTTTVARGMNYVSSNNITVSKALAVVVVLRAFPKAFDLAKETLEAWKIVAKAMHAAANTPWTAWLHAVATAIEIKAGIEKAIIEVVEPIIEQVANVLGVDDEDSGVIWVVMRALHYLGKAVVWATPVLAQVSTNQVFAKNIEPEEGTGWMLPIYPAMPACEGTFADFFDETRYWAEEAADPIYVAGWITLTLSLFPVWYQGSLEVELQRLFTGQESEIQASDPELDAMNAIQDEIDEIAAELRDVRTQRTKILAKLVALAEGVGLDVAGPKAELGEIASRIEYLQADQAKSTEDPPQTPEVDPKVAAAELKTLETRRQQIYGVLVGKVRDRLPDLGSEFRKAGEEALDGDPDGITTRWEAQKDRLEALEDRLENLDVEGAMGDRLDGGMPDDFDGSLGGLQGDAQDRDWPHPWLIDPSGYPDSFSYVGVGLRTLREPIVSARFRRKLDVGIVYAGGRVYNLTRPDLWTAD
ncbi:MAG: pilus assembly protein TadG-related protein, partial [Planctomycetota bacterium]